MPELELVISDAHWPGEHKLLWKLARQIIRTLQPDLITLLGDCVDPSAISHWEKDQALRQRLQEQLDICTIRLSEVRSDAPNSKIVFYRGNHELWLEKFLLEHAPELRNLRAMQLPALLKLDEFNISYLDQPYYVNDLFHCHAHELKLKTSGIYPARNIYHKYFVNTKAIMGHWHVMNSYVHTYHNNKAQSNCGVWLNGTLIDINHVTYTFMPNWQFSVSLCHYSKSGVSFVEQVQLFLDGNRAYCYLFGKLLEIKDDRNSQFKHNVQLL